jgi:hypothetical protein
MVERVSPVGATPPSLSRKLFAISIGLTMVAAIGPVKQ